MSRYTGPVGFGGGCIIALVCILVIIAPPLGLLLSLALAFWKD